MSSTYSLQQRMDDLGKRIKSENDKSQRLGGSEVIYQRTGESANPSPRRPRQFQELGASSRSSSAPSPDRENLRNFGPHRQMPPRPMDRPSLTGAIPRPPDRSFLTMQGHGRSPFPAPPQQPNSAEIERRYKEIMSQTGILTLDRQKYPTEISELEHLGELGHGTCGHVVKMRHKRTNHLMAVKQMRRSGNKEENKRIIMDLDVVIKCHDYPFIVQCIGTFITDSEVWICMELMSTCLDKLLKKTKRPIPEAILGKMAVAIVKALNYLKEEHGVIHRDVKPSNILLDERGTVKLCDFGISGRLVDSKAKTRSAGCAAYMAPERIDPPDPQRPDYDIRADVWSLGITLVELATGEFPYKNCKTDFEVLTKVLQEDPPLLPPGKDFSHEFCSFVRDCLTKDYKKRPKYKKLIEHKFIKRYEKEDVNVAAWFSDVTHLMAVQCRS
ncbi:dual specificity mitogen-activated protein kinase kinase 7-like isoform X2 [Pecten maximus]|uniref:dual specificity mitogen-activated protein kinase kinase 7-like isoform X2 n=1 Tax=Pecten maximus TaxID=6579 RepID=UPI001458D6A4|nr:dual specificity mitogen-activated protein kinase kinase 7-like isoform X2 [Pecten maximus]